VIHEVVISNEKFLLLTVAIGFIVMSITSLTISPAFVTYQTRILDIGDMADVLLNLKLTIFLFLGLLSFTLSVRTIRL
jgi:hypothetical protein